MSDTTTTVNFEEAILKGITANLGLPEDAELLTEEDFINLGKLAADRGAKKRTKFPSWVVTPINDVEKGYEAGHYDGKYDHISNKTVPLKNVEGEKRVYLVPFNKTIGQDAYPALLKEFGLKPCVDGPNYLLGLMKQVPESEMPEELEGKYLVAAESDNPSSAFLDKDGNRCFLHVNRDGSDRGLSMARIGYDWSDYWAFLAEEA